MSYNVLECLSDPPAFLADVFRVLRPGGRAVLGDVDFDAFVIAGAPPALDRLICHAYADDAPHWMDHADGRLARRLPGLVFDSPLRRTGVRLHNVCSTRLRGHAADRVRDMRAALLAAAREGRGTVTAFEVEQWYAALCAADAAGTFLFSETAVVVTAVRFE